MTRYAVALGSNLGDRLGTPSLGCWSEIGGLGEVAAVSGLYETTPVGGPEQGPFLNSVVVLESELEPGGASRRPRRRSRTPMVG